MERIARIDEVTEDGQFRMTLTTEGEASDGHILSIAGGHIPERMPLLVSHWNEPTAQAGSVIEPRKHLRDAPPRISATGDIETGGEGALADIRRDLAHMIRERHIGAVSIRWDDSGAQTRRVNLPKDHPHHVDSTRETDPRKLNGIYFEEWRALEGSIVSIGADPAALIGRAEATEGEVSQFWRSMASTAENPAKKWEMRAPGFGSRDCDVLSDSEQARVMLADSVVQTVRDTAYTLGALEGLRLHVEDCREAGASDAQIVAVLADVPVTEPENGERDSALDETVADLAARVASLETREPARVEVEPEPTIEKAPSLAEALEAAKREESENTDARLVRVFGRVKA